MRLAKYSFRCAYHFKVDYADVYPTTRFTISTSYTLVLQCGSRRVALCTIARVIGILMFAYWNYSQRALTTASTEVSDSQENNAGVTNLVVRVLHQATSQTIVLI